MDATLRQIAEWTNGELDETPSDGPLQIREVVTDSRGSLPEASLFVALVGDRFDGHDFVDDAVSKGAEAALVDRGRASDYPDCRLVFVDDTLEGLQHLAHSWRSRFELPVVGVTGSNGKTIVKEMLAGIFAQEKTVHRSPASYNSQVGVPLTLLELEAEHRISVVEAGISRPGEMERLERMIRPTAGVLTNIGLAHAAGLETLETTAREKLKLFEGLGDGPLIHPAASEPLEPFVLPGDPVSFGCAFATDVARATDDADYLVTEAERGDGGFEFFVEFPDGSRPRFHLHAAGEHNLLNAAASIAAAAEHGISVDALREGLAAYEASPLRLEMHTTPQGVTLINDAYSSDPTSARAALRTLQQYGAGRRKIAILGDMLDLGERSEQAHRELGGVTARTGVDQLICYGDRARAIGTSAVHAGFDPDQIAYTEQIEELHDMLDRLLESEDVVLFKGSRSLELDRAAERLLESVAPTRLQIDLDAIRENYHALRRQIDDETQFMAVVKSFGYGNDSTRVSQTLAQEGVDRLAVAYPDEGIPLRDRGLQLPILVMNVLPAEADKIVKYDLSALSYTRPVVEALADHAARRDADPVPIHVKVETGMNRVGLPPEDAPEFARYVADRDGVRIAGIMTHFAAADIPAEDDFTRRQLDRFRGVLEHLEADDIDPGVLHAANTAAAWRFPEAQFDMVRIGLGLYGLAPSDPVYEAAETTRPALRFTTQIVHIKEVEQGDTVGYGRSWRAPETRTIATVAAGYNDGLPRFMSNGGEVLIAGRRCPIVGDVCMDVSMVDVTDLDAPEVGDEVLIFGPASRGAEQSRVPVDEIARRGDTINYEILCNISPRVRRIFVRH